MSNARRARLSGHEPAGLYVGRRFTGVTVRPDGEWPGMWRINYGGRVSDLLNLPRAKDASLTWFRPRGLGANEVPSWHVRETTPRDALMRQRAWALPGQPPTAAAFHSADPGNRGRAA